MVSLGYWLQKSNFTFGVGGCFFVVLLFLKHQFTVTLQVTFTFPHLTLYLLNGKFSSPSTALYLIHQMENSGRITSPSHASVAVLSLYRIYVRDWLFAAASITSASITVFSCCAPIVRASVIRLSIFRAFPSLYPWSALIASFPKML